MPAMSLEILVDVLTERRPDGDISKGSAAGMRAPIGGQLASGLRRCQAWPCKELINNTKSLRPFRFARYSDCTY